MSLLKVNNISSINPGVDGINIDAASVTINGSPVAAATFASQAEAEAGVDTVKFMNSLRTAQAIAAQTTNKQPIDPTLTSLAAFNTNGLVTQTAPDTFTGRTIQPGSSKVLVSNGNGVAGDPTVDLDETQITVAQSQVTGLAAALAATQPLDATLTSLAAHNTNGLMTQTAPDTFAGRSIVAASPRVFVSNGNGVSGNPSVDVVEANLTIMTSQIPDLGTFQASDPTLDALAAHSALGFVVQTAPDTFAGRGLAAGSSKVSITDPSGISGNPTIDVTEANLTLGNIGGTLPVSKGGTNTTSLTGDKAIVSNGAGTAIVESAVTSTELGYVSGVTSAIQTQLDSKVDENAAITPATFTKITYDAKGLVTAGAAAQLASADFANQGTTTTILHGNAAGNPSFSQVVDADIATHTSTKISITAKGQLNSAIAYTDQANTFGNFDQTFSASNLKIVSSADSTKVLTFTNAGQTTGTTTTISNLNTATRTIQIPAVTATDTFSMLGLAQTITGVKTFSDATLLVNNPANTFAYTLKGSAITAARQLTLPLTTQTETLAVQPQVYQASPANPTGTTSTTGVMAGLAGAITPRVTGRVLITISGDLTNSAEDAGASVVIRYGTGTAPTNGSALTGTVVGNLSRGSVTASSTGVGATFFIPFTCHAIVSGLTVGTAIWIDLAQAAVTTGTASISDLSITVFEL